MIECNYSRPDPFQKAIRLVKESREGELNRLKQRLLKDLKDVGGEENRYD